MIQLPTYNNEVLKRFYKVRDEVNMKISNIYILLCSNTSPAAISILEKNIDRINWYILSANPAAIELLMKNKDKIHFCRLCLNPAPEAIELLKENPDKIHWDLLCRNHSPAAFELLLQNLNKIELDTLTVRNCLSANPAAIDYLLKYQYLIYSPIACNTSSKAIEWMRNNPGRINWLYLSSNPAAMPLILKEPRKICWPNFSMNHAPEAIKMLKENKNRVDKYSLIFNPALFEIIEDYPEKEKQNILSYFNIYKLPTIFTYDYYAMRASRAALREELTAWWWHPRRVAAFLAAGGDIEELDNMIV